MGQEHRLHAVDGMPCLTVDDIIDEPFVGGLTDEFDDLVAKRSPDRSVLGERQQLVDPS